MAERMSNDTEFMSRKETNKLILMGIVLLLLVIYVLKGTFQPAAEDSGVPVKVQGTTGQGIPVRVDTSGPGVDYEPPIPTVSPSQNAVGALEALRAYEEDRTSGNVATVSSKDWAYDPKKLATAGDLQLDVVDEPALYHLLARLNYMTVEQVERAPAELGTFVWSDLRPPNGFDRKAPDFSHLDKMRGKFVHIEGRFLTHLSQRVLETYPNEAGLAWVWQGTFMAGNKGYFILIIDKEFEPRIGPNGDAIAIDGAFLKLYSFQPVNAAMGVKSYPLLVVKSFNTIPPPKKWDYMFDAKLWVGIGVLLIFVLATYFYAVASRKGEAKIDDWRRGRYLKRARRDLEEGLAKVAEAGGSAEPAPGVRDAHGQVAEPGGSAEPDPSGGSAEAGPSGGSAEAGPSGGSAEAGPAGGSAEPGPSGDAGSA